MRFSTTLLAVFAVTLVVHVSGARRYKLDINDMVEPEIGAQYTETQVKRRWPSNTVYYEFSPTLSNYTDKEKDFIKSVLAALQNETCIKFVPKTDQTAYVSFQNQAPGTCNSLVGYMGKKQAINARDFCPTEFKNIAHETMHALGFSHEQSRFDRDLHIEVLWENIQPHTKHNFLKKPRTRAYPKYPYDFSSVMQYQLGAGGTDGRPAMAIFNLLNLTIIPEREIGYSKYLSKTDIWRINSAYKCDSSVRAASRRSMRSLTPGQIKAAKYFEYI